MSSWKSVWPSVSMTPGDAIDDMELFDAAISCVVAAVLLYIHTLRWLLWGNRYVVHSRGCGQ